MSILTDISENLQRGKAKIVKELVQQAIDEGIPVQQIPQTKLRYTSAACLRMHDKRVQ